MEKNLYEGEEISKSISEQTEAAQDFNSCMALSEKYWSKVYPSCNETIRTRLFELCFDGHLIVLLNAFRYKLLVEYSSYGAQYLRAIFQNFSEEGQRSYTRLADSDKELYLLEKTREYLASQKDFYNVLFLYQHSAKVFPQLTSLMEETLFSLCYPNGNLSEEKASKLVEVFGIHHPLSRLFLNSFLKHSVVYLLVSVVICVGSILIIANLPVPGWSFIIWTPLILGFGTMGIQYVIKTIDALRNYGKEKNYKFDTGVLAYQKGANGWGRYKRVDSPIRKPHNNK